MKPIVSVWPGIQAESQQNVEQSEHSSGPMELTPGEKLGPYEVISVLGSGGMGSVYRANDSRLHREVAIKVSAECFSDRFEREARAVAALNHQNVCTPFDIGPNYLVMELIEGETLAEHLKQGAMPFEQAVALAKQIASSLEAAHDKGITHRDLKAGNVMIRHDGTVKVLDFGLAKMPDPVSTVGSDPNQSPTMTTEAATKLGVILGTAGYMAPEQAKGKRVDKRADIWAFGVVFYEMLTGARLFEGETMSETSESIGRIRISRGGGANAAWSADGNTLFYNSPDDRLLSVKLKIAGDRIEAGEPRATFPLGGTSGFNGAIYWEPIGNGERFIVLRSTPVTGRDNRINVLLNWQPGLN